MPIPTGDTPATPPARPPMSAQLEEQTGVAWVLAFLGPPLPDPSDESGPRFQATLSFRTGFRVHRAGCKGLDDPQHAQHDRPLDLEATTAEGIAAELHADFIEEGSMRPGEALEQVTFLPCTGLN